MSDNKTIREFFAIKPEEALVKYEEIHHMLTEVNSGWTFQDLYFMPVAMRKWFHAKYNEKIQKLNEANKPKGKEL